MNVSWILMAAMKMPPVSTLMEALFAAAMKDMKEMAFFV